MTTKLVKNVILEIEKLKKNKDIDNKDFKKLIKQIIQKVQPRKLTDWNIFIKQKIPEIKKMYQLHLEYKVMKKSSKNTKRVSILTMITSPMLSNISLTTTTGRSKT